MRCWGLAPQMFWGGAVLAASLCFATLALAAEPAPFRVPKNAAFVRCDGGLGAYDVYVAPSKQTPGSFEITILPFRVQMNPAERADIVITNKSLKNQTLAGRIVLKKDQAFVTRILTAAELKEFDILAIALHEDGVQFKNKNNPRDVLCTLPLPPALQRPVPRTNGPLDRRMPIRPATH